MTASPRYATFLLLAVVGHHWVLCLLHTQGSAVSVVRVAAAELLIYAACLPLLLRHLSLRALIAVFAALGAMGLMALLRGGYFDAKAMRDLLIPLVFVWAGRSYAQGGRTPDGPLLAVTAVVCAIGLVQAAVPDFYNRFFNTFSYYIQLGGILADAAQVQGQTVTLNALRPDGIGRTILPQLFGAQRVSSVFLEPVSLGNFAVLLLSFGLAKPWQEWRQGAWFVSMAALLIALSDSRFGLYVAGLLVLVRVLVRGRAHAAALVLPLVGAAALLAVATWAPGTGDNLHGRVTTSGQHLMAFDEWSLLGLRDFGTNFGDMGYAYVVSRFGLFGALLMWVAVFMLPAPTEPARRFRSFVSVYVTLILCVSGTSLFALKTAGVLWFLMGALSRQGQPEPAQRQAQPAARPAFTWEPTRPDVTPAWGRAPT